MLSCPKCQPYPIPPEWTHVFNHGELLPVRAVQILTEHRERNRILQTVGPARTESDRWAERRPFRDVRIHRVAEAHVPVEADLVNELRRRVTKHVSLDARAGFGISVKITTPRRD